MFVELTAASSGNKFLINTAFIKRVIDEGSRRLIVTYKHREYGVSESYDDLKAKLGVDSDV